MKKLMIMMLSVALVSGVSAQRHGGGAIHGGGYYPRTTVVVPSYGYGVGLGLGYGYPYYGYPFYGFPAYGYNYGNARPSKLTQKIEDIKNDYADRIYSARNDGNLKGKARREEVRQLKHERDEAINNLKSNYYKSPKQQVN